MGTLHRLSGFSAGLAMVASVVVWLAGSMTAGYFLMWALSVTDNQAMSVETVSTLAAWIAGVLVVVDVTLVALAARGQQASRRVIGGCVAAVATLATAGFLLPHDDILVVHAFLVPTLAFALVLPVALIGRRRRRLGSALMGGLALGHALAAAAIVARDLQMWAIYLDYLGAFASGAIALLLLASAALAQPRADEAAQGAPSPRVSASGLR